MNPIWGKASIGYLEAMYHATATRASKSVMGLQLTTLKLERGGSLWTGEVSDHGKSGCESKFDGFRRTKASKALVPPVGVEPTRLAAPDFESGASTNSTTGASGIYTCR